MVGSNRREASCSSSLIAHLDTPSFFASLRSLVEGERTVGNADDDMMMILQLPTMGRGFLGIVEWEVRADSRQSGGAHVSVDTATLSLSRKRTRTARTKKCQFAR